MIYETRDSQFGITRNNLKRNAQRELTSTEAFHLRRLELGANVTLETPSGEANSVRLFGALTAGTQCIACHTDAQPGQLLGALVYDLEPQTSLFSGFDPPSP